MTIAKTVDQYLRRNDVEHFGLVNHEHSGCTSEAAQRSHVSSRHIAKGIVVKHDGGFALVVVPANCYVSVPRMRELFGEDANLATESELAPLFPDCDVGEDTDPCQSYESCL